MEDRDRFGFFLVLPYSRGCLALLPGQGVDRSPKQQGQLEGGPIHLALAARGASFLEPEPWQGCEMLPGGKLECDTREGCKLNTFFHFVCSSWQICPLVSAWWVGSGMCRAQGPTVASSIGKLPQLVNQKLCAASFTFAFLCCTAPLETTAALNCIALAFMTSVLMI